MKVIQFIKAFFAAAALTTVSVGPAFAQPVPVVTGVIYNGSGCPVGTLPPIIDPATNTLYFQFLNYIAVGNSVVDKYKTCNFVASLKLPKGFQISIYNAEYQGFVDSGTIGMLRAKYSLSSGSIFGGINSSGPPSSTLFMQNLNGPIDYDVTHNLATVNLVSACSQNVNLVVNTSMRATGVGIATVDTLELRKGLVYYWNLQPC